MSSVSLPPPTVEQDTCAAGGAGAPGCRVCVESCPYQAIGVRDTPDGAQIRIEAQLCQRCGACSGVCPTSSITRPFLPDEELVDAIIDAAEVDDGPVVAITCPASADRVQAAVGPGHTVVAASLLVVNETHLLAGVAAGASGVVVVGCPACTHDQPQLLLPSLSVARAVVGEPRRVAYVEDDRTDALHGAIVAAAELGAPAASIGPIERMQLTATATRRDRLRTLVAALGSGGSRSLAAPGFGTIELDDQACVACGACAIACPTDALRFDPAVAELAFTDMDCVGCGVCVSVCPDDALTLQPGVPAGPGAAEARTLLTDPAVSCRTCGRDYAAQRLLDHARDVLLEAGVDPDDPQFQLGVCPECREVGLRQHSLDRFPQAQDCGCGDGGGACGSDGGGCACQPEGAHAGGGSSRRAFLKGAVGVAAAAAALPLLGRHQPAIAVEQAPVIYAGRLGMVIDLERCIGCHACTNICKAENNVPLGGFRDWVEEHELGSGTDEARPVFLPKLCNQCDDAGCLKACPTGAIFRRPDGIVDLDTSICIACQACMQGCPYGMTFYNGVTNTADKCNYCAHRIDDGLRPACVDICPSQCRIFGDLDDPDSEVSRYLATHETQVLKEDLGFGPQTHYVGLPGELDR